MPGTHYPAESLEMNMHVILIFDIPRLRLRAGETVYRKCRLIPKFFCRQCASVGNHLLIDVGGLLSQLDILITLP
jgi:hypothetical protein